MNIRFASLLLLLSALLASPAAAQQTFYDNVVIVLDASGSMDGMFTDGSQTKMDAAKQALAAVVKQLPETTHVGLLVFSAANQREDWVYPLGPLDQRELLSGVLPLRPDGDTPLGGYIKKGADRLLQARQEQHGYGTYRLLVVTDGEASDPDVMDRFTPEVVARGITLDVIGVDMLSDHTLERMAHSYRGADDPTALVKAVGEVFAEISFSASDAAGGDAFQVLDGLPDEFAMALLDALSTSGNHPIGTRP